MALVIPSAAQCAAVVLPAAGIWGVVWFARHGDRVIERLFPHWEWERKMGRLNLRANRRAEAMLCLLRHALHALLLSALADLLFIGWLIGQPRDPEDGGSILMLAVELTNIALPLALWIYYFTAILGPRLRAEYEEEELRRYRAENPEEDKNPRDAATTVNRITVWDTPRDFRRR